MKEFLQVLRRFVPPYKKYLAWSVVFNILSAVLNIFSFAALIPILQILFQTGDTEAASGLMEWDWGNIQAVLMNNLNYYVTQLRRFADRQQCSGQRHAGRHKNTGG